jgi:membrane fusion protein (multidrug efflux system)
MSRSFGALVLLLIVVLLPVGLAGCGKHEEMHEEEEHRLLVTRPLNRDTAITRDYVGQIRSGRHIEVRALERGYLEDILVSEGQHVEAGQSLFKILPLTYEAELRRAQAEAESARLEYENTRLLAENDVVSQTELALSKAKYDRARAEVSLAQAHLGFMDLKAPFPGLVDRLHLRHGSLVEEGDLLTTLSDNDEMWVYFNVPEAEYLHYVQQPDATAGRPVELVMADGKLFPRPGRIAVIEADFNNRTGTIPFRADFPNPDGLLRNGETGNIRVTTALPNALIIPQKATFDVLDHQYVFVVDENDVVHQRLVEISHEVEDLFVVRSGVTEKDKIVLEGLRQTRDGRKVEYEFQEPDVAYADLKVPAQ